MRNTLFRSFGSHTRVSLPGGTGFSGQQPTSFFAADASLSASNEKKKRMSRSICLLFFLAVTSTCRADEPIAVPKNSTDFHLFLLSGQSNMAGRGKVADEDRQPHSRVLMLNKAGEWVPAADPLHFDKPGIVGVGLGKTFAIEYAEKHPGVVVGLIPCAVGGSPIDAWKPGGYHKSTKTHPYDDCLARMKKTLPAGTLKGILWHQGESDSNVRLSETYEGKLHELINRFRTEFNSPNVPFIAGQMGQFKERPWNAARKQVDAAHRSLPEKVDRTAFVSSDGLNHKGDQVHFDAASYRELGRRCLKAFEKLTAAE